MSTEQYTRRDVLAAGAALSGNVKAAARLRGPIIDSARWELELSEKGAVMRLTHKPSGQVLIDPGPDAPAYELTTPEGIENNLAAAVSLSPLKNDRGRGFRFVSEYNRKTVTMDVIEVQEHGGIEFRVHIRNLSEAPITAIKYPILIAPAQLGASAEDDAILLPFLDGGIVDNPAREFTATPAAHQTYPGRASSQLVAYYDKTAGVYVASHDSSGNGKLLGATRRKDARFDLSISHLRPRVVQQDMDVPYPVVLDTFTGDWYAAAEKYRVWSLKQPWARERLETSKKLPKWLRAGALVAEFDPTRRNLDQQRDDFRQLREWFTAPILPNNRGWENGGMWMSPWYLPPRPSPEEFRKSATLIKEIGGRGMVMLSGYRWTLENLNMNRVFMSQEEFEAKVARDAQCGPDGKPRIWNKPPSRNSWMPTKWARICRATERAKRDAIEVARFAVQAGYPVMHWDQENAGEYAGSVCFSKLHGHPPGDGVWVHQSMEDLYRRFWTEVAPMSEDFALSMEQANELYMPFLTMAQSRPFTMGKVFSNLPPMTRVVPLLNYLHHEHFLGWAAYYPWRVAPDDSKFLPDLARASLAKGFNCGLMPGVALGTLRQYARQSQSDLDDYVKLFGSCMEGYLGYARRALMFGRMMRPLDLAVPVRTLAREQLPPLRWPVVDNSVWHTSEGNITVVLINHTKLAQTASVPFAEVAGWSAGMNAFGMTKGAETALHGGPAEIQVPALSMMALQFRLG